MIYSMTGYGQAIGEYGDKQIQVELKSLNGKATDLRLRVPSNYKEKEIILRKMILDKALRGKLDASVSMLSGQGEDGYALNKALFKKYFNEISDLKTELGINEGDLVQTVMRIPNVIMPVEEPIKPEEWDVVVDTLERAVEAFLEFRAAEGAALKNDLYLRAENIEDHLANTTVHEESRIEAIKKKMKKNLINFFANESIDENRFEQELIYYIEKLDITEEKVRLVQHCKYFKEVLDSDEPLKGKKLGFISQEIGREINTLGAKSQNSELQVLVVSMKDELEKIKEQVANTV